MKSSRMLFLFAVTMMTAAINAGVADENVPMMTDGVVNLEQYLFNGVGRNGPIMVRRFVKERNNDNFGLPNISAQGMENAAMPNNMIRVGVIVEASPAAIAAMLKQFVNEVAFDNDGDTALDTIGNEIKLEAK